MVGMDMGFERVGEPQAELGDQCRIAPHLLEHRVDQHRRACAAVAQEVGVGRGLRIEQLTKDQHCAPPRRSGARYKR